MILQQSLSASKELKSPLTKLSPISPEKLIRILERIGFIKIRQRGSHVFLRHPDGRTTVIPVHKGEKISKGLLTKIIIDIGLTKDEFLELI